MNALELISRLEALVKLSDESSRSADSFGVVMLCDGKYIAYSVALRLVREFLRSNGYIESSK